ncbi:hypothetical protein BANRA_05297 [Klebsiella pneumoniae]|nr:hypothetical protein BANRA_05297 [Klebsiella pneumoniae]
MAVRSPSSATSAARAVQDDGPGSAKPPPAAAVAACRLPASQIAVCTSRTSAVVIKCRPRPRRRCQLARPRTVAASVRTSRATAMPPTMPGRTRPTAGKTAPAPGPRCWPLFDADQPRVGQPLRVMLCIAAPASPAWRSAIRIRGRRISNRIKRGCSPISCGASSPRQRRRGQRIAAAAKAVQPQRQQRQHYAGGNFRAAGSSWREAKASGRKPAR